MKCTKLSIITLFFAIFWHSLSYAASYGVTCSYPSSTLMSDSVSSYLKTNSLYKYIAQYIDISSDCSNTSNTINACVKQLDGTCANVQFEDGQAIQLSTITNDPVFASDAMKDVYLFSASTSDTEMCIMVPSIYTYVPLLCKTIEPATATAYQDTTLSTRCNDIDACKNIGAAKHSRSGFNFSGQIVNCMREMLNFVFFDTASCYNTTTSAAGVVDSSSAVSTISQSDNYQSQNLKPFAQFYDTLQQFVFGMIIIYVILYAFNLMLNPEEADIKDAFMSIIKILLVLYFSIGLSVTSWMSGSTTKDNATANFLIPFMLDIANGLTNVVFASSSQSSGLCYFDVTQYGSGYEYYALFDAIDCRVGLFIGAVKITTSGGDPTNTGGKLSLSIIAYIALFSLFVSLFISGFVLIFLGIAVNMFIAMLFSTVVLYALSYMAPIFVPMALFERTKGYFDSWVDLCFSMILQPIIIVGFGAYVLIFFDNSYYKGCQFNSYTYSKNGATKVGFYLNPQNMSSDCKSSVGYIMSDLIEGNKFKKINMGFSSISIPSVIPSVEQAVLIFVFSVIIFFMNGKIGQLASFISGGVSISGMLIDANALLKGAMKVVTAAAKTGYDLKKQGDDKAKAQADYEKGGG